MSEYDDVEEFADFMEAVADDAGMAGDGMQNLNNRHPLATFNLGVEFGLRYAAYEARVISDE